MKFLKLKHYVSLDKLQQTFTLLVVSIGVMLLSLGINFFLTRILSKELFGDYSLVVNIFLFSQILFNFGFFYGISRLIGIEENNLKQRELYGVGLIITFFLFIIMSICLLIYTCTIKDEIVISGLLVSIPFGWAVLLNSFNELTLQGNNKIYLLSISRFFPKLLMLISVFSVYIFNLDSKNITAILILYFLSSILPFSYILYDLQPVFKNLKANWIVIKKSVFSFGFNIYIGSVLAVGASSISGILISYFGVNNIEVGYYSIALQISAPLSLIPNVLGTVFFKKFINSKTIEYKIIVLMLVISVILFALILIGAKFVILYIYGNSYINSLKLIYYLSASSLLYGIADFFNKFLLSKGKGKELRNASILVGLTLLVSNILLISGYGAVGAAVSTIISGLMYLLVIIFYYFKSIK